MIMESERIANQQERPNDYDLKHQRMKELLGDAYNQEKIDAIVAGNFDFEKIMKEIKEIPISTNPVQRRQHINQWYKSHKEELEMFGK